MNNSVKDILYAVQKGSMSVQEAALKLKTAPFEDIGFAKVDLHRKLRQGVAEVIYSAGKTPEQIMSIIDVMRRNGQSTILITRLSFCTA
jgi:NCAIR mutase (PurE)-related protein